MNSRDYLEMENDLMREWTVRRNWRVTNRTKCGILSLSVKRGAYAAGRGETAMTEKCDVLFTPAGELRRLHIYLPDGYNDSEERYPVMYFFDGHNLFYDKDATYWAFYINGEYAMSGVDTTEIEADTSYAFKIEK